MERHVDDITELLQKAGFVSGDSVFIHCGLKNLSYRMFPEASDRRNPENRNKVSDTFHHGVRNSIGGDAGTIILTGYWYEYGRFSQHFDCKTAPPDRSLGTFPQHFFKHYMTHRSLCAPVSLMGCGAKGREITRQHDSIYGYGLHSPWARLIEHDAWFLFWGASARSLTFAHHMETIVGVPHIYNKFYRVPVTSLEGKAWDYTICSNRFLDDRFPIFYRYERMDNELRQEGIIKTLDWHGHEIYVSRAVHMADFLNEKFRTEPFYLMEKTPTFVEGVIPTDGKTAQHTVKHTYVA